MDVPPLSPRELMRLAKLDRRLAAGRLRFGLRGAAMGFVGGLGWVALVAVLSPGFGRDLGATSGNTAHPEIEQVFRWLAALVGPLAAICLVAGTLFGGAFFAFAYGTAWRLLVGNHAALARRAIAAGQFRPRYRSALLRWQPTRT